MDEEIGDIMVKVEMSPVATHFAPYDQLECVVS